MPQQGRTTAPSSRGLPDLSLEVAHTFTDGFQRPVPPNATPTYTDNIKSAAFAQKTDREGVESKTGVNQNFIEGTRKIVPVRFNVAEDTTCRVRPTFARRTDRNDVTEVCNSVYNFSSRAMLTARPQNYTSLGLPTDFSIFDTVASHVNPRIMELYSANKFTPQISATATGQNCGQPEYCSGRYKARKPANTNIVDVNPMNLPTSRRQARGVSGFFPPVKLRSVADPNNNSENYAYTSSNNRKRVEMKTPPFVLELAPEEAMQWSDLAGRVPSAKSVARSDPIWNSAYKSLSMTPPVYPHLMPEPNCDDLTTMPRPRMMVSRGDLPWVYRQKVKKNMNKLSKIMASCPAQSMDGSSFAYSYDH